MRYAAMRRNHAGSMTFSRHSSMEGVMDDLSKEGQQHRSKINMHQEHEVRYWTKHLNVTKEELQNAVNKVGNSAAAVRKQLGA